MNESPTVSIIMPAYKSKPFIRRSIESVLSQSFENWELIIVDDASGDNLKNYVNNFTQDKRIIIIQKEKNEGAARARNDAINIANGKFIAFLDSDDIWKPEKLKLQLKFMLENDYEFTFTSYEIINLIGEKQRVRVPEKIDYDRYLKNTIIGTSTVMLNREKINDIKLVDVRQDHDSMTWLKIMRENDIPAHGLGLSLTRYQKRKGSISSNKLKAAYIHHRNLKRIEKIPFFKRYYVFINYCINAFIKHYSNRRI